MSIIFYGKIFKDKDLYNKIEHEIKKKIKIIIMKFLKKKMIFLKVKSITIYLQEKEDDLELIKMKVWMKIIISH